MEFEVVEYTLTVPASSRGAVGEGNVFSMGSGRLSTVSAGAGTSFAVGASACLGTRFRRLHHQNTATTIHRNSRDPITAPATAPLLTPPPEPDPEVSIGTHLLELQVVQLLQADVRELQTGKQEGRQTCLSGSTVRSQRSCTEQGWGTKHSHQTSAADTTNSPDAC